MAVNAQVQGIVRRMATALRSYGSNSDNVDMVVELLGEQLGSGQFSTVLSIDGYPDLVFKIGNGGDGNGDIWEDGYLRFAMFCLMRQGNPNLPVIHKVFVDRKFFIVVMKKYDSIYGHWEELAGQHPVAREFRKDFQNGIRKWDISNSPGCRLALELREGVEAASYGLDSDTHDGNFLWDAETSNLIVSDPVGFSTKAATWAIMRRVDHPDLELSDGVQSDMDEEDKPSTPEGASLTEMLGMRLSGGKPVAQPPGNNIDRGELCYAGIAGCNCKGRRYSVPDALTRIRAIAGPVPAAMLAVASGVIKIGPTGIKRANQDYPLRWRGRIGQRDGPPEFISFKKKIAGNGWGPVG
jgi:hypothetical protein